MEICEKCSYDYETGPSWEDSIYCTECYHEMFGCPDWCEWEDCGLEAQEGGISGK